MEISFFNADKKKKTELLLVLRIHPTFVDQRVWHTKNKFKFFLDTTVTKKGRQDSRGMWGAAVSRDFTAGIPMATSPPGGPPARHQVRRRANNNCCCSLAPVGLCTHPLQCHLPIHCMHVRIAICSPRMCTTLPHASAHPLPAPFYPYVAHRSKFSLQAFSAQRPCVRNFFVSRTLLP